MEPYRKKVDLPSGSDYWFVHLGPIPERPEWHKALYEKSSYPFPSEAAAKLFAQRHKNLHPNRSIEIKRGT